MVYFRPKNLLAGFHTEAPEAGVPELTHAGEQWAPSDYLIADHVHPVWEFYLQVSGQSRWESFESASVPRRYLLQPGHFFAAAPGVRHGLNKRVPAKHHFFFAGIDLLPVFERHPQLKPLWTPGRCCHLSSGHGLQGLFRQLVRELTSRLPLRAEGLRAAVDYLVIEASRLRIAASGSGLGVGRSLLPTHPAVLIVQELLDRQFAEPWGLADLGRLTGMSPNHLAQLFRNETGVPPHQYLLRQRIERAKELLAQTDVPVTQLALELGFSSSQHFAKIFRLETKSSAASFRKRSR